MDGQELNVAEWLQIARFAVVAFAAIGAGSTFFFMFKWYRNGTTRRNALEMTPGHATCCRKNREAIIRLQSGSGEDHQQETSK